MKVLYIGSDVSKKELDVALRGNEIEKSCGQIANSPFGYKKLNKLVAPYIEAGYEIHLVAEPTGTYHLRLVAHAYEQGWNVSLPNPVLVRLWSKGQGHRVKTDKIDARTLASYGYKESPNSEQPLPEHVQQLDMLIRRKDDIEKSLRQERNRLESFEQRPTVCSAVCDSILTTIEFHENALEQIDQQIQAHLKLHPDLKHQKTLLLSVSGVGKKGVLKLLVFLHRWDARTSGLGDAKGLTAFAGLDPVDHSSGSSIHRHPPISKMGDAVIRRTLFMSALGGVKAKDSPLVHFYKRLLGRGKPKKLALVASARKILTWAFGVFRSGEFFDPAKAMPKTVSHSI